MKINTKIMLLVGLSLFAVSVVVGILAVWKIHSQGEMAVAQIESIGNRMISQLDSNSKRELEAYRRDLLAAKKEYLRSEVETAISGLTKFIGDLEALQTEALRSDTDEALRKAMEAEAKEKAADLIKHLRYGPENKDYFWINDMGPVMIMHPYKPQLNGKDLSQIKDPTGKKLFMEFVKVCQAKGEGFVQYQWPKYGSNKPQPKLSFVKLFKKWNWIIGTGTYLDGVENAVQLRAASIESSLKEQRDSLEKLINETKAGVAKQIRRTMLSIGLVCLCILVLTLAAAYVFSVRSISRPINSVIEKLDEGSAQVSSAASQLSDSSQVLSEGASEQAAALEQTSSSLEEISSMTKQNAANASEANNLMKTASNVVEDANMSMQKLTAAMDSIAKSSEETSKIIKTIDEIAFQTNLLALNAAVEAARAGEAGAGFAVVADEVRNLAMRAAEAAKDTSVMIQENVGKIKEGSQLVSEANQAFSKVLDSSKKVAQLLNEIAEASDEQSAGIEQVTKAVAEMDKVVQRNAANSEESASASEQLAAQVYELENIVKDLTKIVGQASDASGEHEVGKTVSMPSVSEAGASQVKPSDSQHSRAAELIPLDEEQDFKEF